MHLSLEKISQALGELMIENESYGNKRQYCHSQKIDVVSIYVDYMLNQFPHLKKMKNRLFFDCGNGVADTVLTQILDKLELNYKAIYTTPDGTFPNHHPDPSEKKNILEVYKALEGDFEYGFAYDGDADRIAFLTPSNNVKGDILALLFATTMKNPVIVGEVKCTQVMYDIINKNGSAHMYKTGAFQFKSKIKRTQCRYGSRSVWSYFL